MPVTLNAYGYCWGNPMGYVDGRWPEVSDIVKKYIVMAWHNIKIG